MIMEDKKITDWLDEKDMDKSTHPVHIMDNATGKCCGIHFSLFKCCGIHFSSFDSPGKKPLKITFGLAGAQQQPEMAVLSDDETIGKTPLTLMPILNAIGEYTLHIEAIEKEKVLIDGEGVKNLEYSYQLYNGDTIQVGNSTFTIYFNYFKPPCKGTKRT